MCHLRTVFRICITLLHTVSWFARLPKLPLFFVHITFLLVYAKYVFVGGNRDIFRHLWWS